MKRPAHKKHRDPLFSDDDQIDERNLIDLEDSADISFEDRVNIYWMDNKGFMIGCVTVLIVAIVGYQGMLMYKEQAELELQADYAEARTNETLADFAKAHANKDLGGFAALITADDAYRAEDYSQALEFYGIAADAIEDGILAGRAQLGQAFALYQSGSEAEGLAKLNAIVADNSLAEAARAEAAYHLAIEADSAGRTDEFDSYAAQINNSPLAGQWQQRLDYYQQSGR
jgi:hypothetical protein